MHFLVHRSCAENLYIRQATDWNFTYSRSLTPLVDAVTPSRLSAATSRGPGSETLLGLKTSSVFPTHRIAAGGFLHLSGRGFPDASRSKLGFSCIFEEACRMPVSHAGRPQLQLLKLLTFELTWLMHISRSLPCVTYRPYLSCSWGGCNHV